MKGELRELYFVAALGKKDTPILMPGFGGDLAGVH